MVPGRHFAIFVKDETETDAGIKVVIERHFNFDKYLEQEVNGENVNGMNAGIHHSCSGGFLTSKI